MKAFDRVGFDGVTVEQIADDAGVSPISVYRWFGTKENLVLWDEYDPPLFEAIAARLPRFEPLVAVRDGLIAELDKLYEAERATVLSRARLIMKEPALLAAATRNQSDLSAGLAELFKEVDPDGDRFRHRVLAAVAVATLTESILEWTCLDGAVPLREVIEGGFEALRRSQWDT